MAGYAIANAMTLTQYHAKYLAYELTRRRRPDSIEKLAGQKQVRAIEAQRGQKRRSLFDAQDEVERQRDQLIGQIEARFALKVSSLGLFNIRWSLQ